MDMTPEEIYGLWRKLVLGGNNVYNGRQIILTEKECSYLSSLLPDVEL